MTAAQWAARLASHRSAQHSANSFAAHIGELADCLDAARELLFLALRERWALDDDAALELVRERIDARLARLRTAA